MEFGYNGDKSGTKSTTPNGGASGDGVTNVDTGKINNTVGGEDVDDINGISDSGNQQNINKPIDAFGDNTNKPNTEEGNKPDNSSEGDNNDKTAENGLVVGSTIEVEDNKYTVDDKGNVLDDKGNIFKEAAAVKDWLATFDDVSGEDNELSIKSIQEQIGIELVGEDDKPIEFENTPAGVKAYVDAVIDTTREEVREETINEVFNKYPFVSDMINYYVANGNSLEGFNETPNYSTITIDDTNEAQQESVIRTAWKERGQKGDVDGYIQYLKSSGTLLATSQQELVGLQENEAQYKQQLADDAKAAEAKHIESMQKYWGGVQNIIKSKNIAGYKIPDTIIRNVNGQKQGATLNDFFNYMYNVDKQGLSAYQNELVAETPESRMNDEILRAYIKFTGGNYSDLVGMAINKEKVDTLKLRAKTKTANSVKITKPTPVPAKGKNLDLGFN